jgi:diguanylate cyclase (GGDEF)-like protein
LPTGWIASSLHPRRAGLTARVVLFVFATTAASAAIVSATAVQATRSRLWTDLESEHGAAAARAAEGLDAWLAGSGGTLPEPGAADEALRPLLEAARPDPATRVWLADDQGRVLAPGPPGADAELRLFSLPGPRSGALREYADAGGRGVLGIAHPLRGARAYAVVETSAEAIHAPIRSRVALLLAVDAIVAAIFTAIGLHFTRALLRPISALSERARRIALGELDLELPEHTREDEIGLLARSFADMLRRLREDQHEIAEANRILTARNLELQQAKEAFEQLSITDGLTRLHNHRFFHESLTREIKRVNRIREPLSMLLIDIDDFKRLNDRLGHAAGDELLSGIARILNDCVRESDLLARYGGEEFVVLASDTDREGAALLAEKIRTAIAENSFILDDSLRPTRVTVSIGVAQYGGNRKTFFRAADRALYRAKEQGKNCVVVDEEAQVI